MDLADACFGAAALDVRRLVVLIRHLPPDSALRRDLGLWWTPELELAAELMEVTWQCFRQLVALGGARGSRIPRSLNYPRPVPYAGAGPAPGGGAPAEPRRRPRTLKDYRVMFAGGRR